MLSLNISNLNKENFYTFNENIFSDDVDVAKYKLNISPRKNMINIRQKCLSFVENFDDPNLTITATSRKKTALDFVCKIEVYNPENLHLRCIQDNMLIQTQNNLKPNIPSALDLHA